MLLYIFKRILYAIPILIGVNLITFMLFFMVNSPDDMARAQLGAKQITPKMIEAWKEERGYNRPLFLNESKDGIEKFTDTLFFQESLKLFLFDFGKSDSNRDIKEDIKSRVVPSLMVAVPTFIIGLGVNISFALLLVVFRNSLLDRVAMVIAVMLMSISSLFYIIIGQVLFAKMWHWFPISGYANGFSSLKFIVLPVLIGVFAGVGSTTRWYRSIFLEEINKEYIKTARAKGLSEICIVFKHLLPNAMLPILTGVVVVIPTLFMGSLIMESFFGIPGLGSYTIDAIRSQDFAIVKAMVFLGSFMYIVGLILTDISYTIFDPRVKLK
jgi:peptide/nickel transport system permease protein